MKISIRTRFTLGMAFFFVIIAGLSILSSYHLNRLSTKTDAILKENHFSVIFAREMAEGLTILNQEVTRSFLTGKSPDNNLILKTSAAFKKSLQSEKNNITEAGEDKLAADIEAAYGEYLEGISLFAQNTKSQDNLNLLQTQFRALYKQTILLSQMNEQAIILKANDIKKSAKNGLTIVTLFGTVCFIIAVSFTFNFASYFNERFSRLYNGIRQIGAGNYDQRLHFDGEDEFYDISLIFNDMVNSINEKEQVAPMNLTEEFERETNQYQLQELRKMIEQMKDIKEQASELIAKLEHKE
jgi:hypothetical protein